MSQHALRSHLKASRGVSGRIRFVFRLHLLGPGGSSDRSVLLGVLILACWFEINAQFVEPSGWIRSVSASTRFMRCVRRSGGSLPAGRASSCLFVR